MTKITRFADADHFGWDQETGQPTASHFANAIQVWSIAQDRPVTVDEAAIAFNVAPDLIHQCVDGFQWMYLDGDRIEHDGE